MGIFGDGLFFCVGVGIGLSVLGGLDFDFGWIDFVYELVVLVDCVLIG